MTSFYLHANSLRPIPIQNFKRLKSTNTVKNHEVISNLRGDGVEAYKIKIFPLETMSIIHCDFFSKSTPLLENANSHENSIYMLMAQDIKREAKKLENSEKSKRKFS